MTFPQFHLSDALSHPVAGLADLQSGRNHARNGFARQVGFVAGVGFCKASFAKRFDRDVAAIVSDNAVPSLCRELATLPLTSSGWIMKR
jgi:hypothetical protein